MKIQIASDIHLEFGTRSLPAKRSFVPVPDRDVLVLAGDIGRGKMARAFVERELAVSPVVYVPGNHEYYSRHSRDSIDADWRAIAAEHPDLHYLVAEGTTVDGVRFWGAPWYSDLWGAKDRRVIGLVRYAINDFCKPNNAGGAWTVSRHIDHHVAQTCRLGRQAGQVDVVVTHWPPTKEAIHPKLKGDGLNPYYVNDKEDLVRAIGAKLWVSGHVHEAYDYRIGDARCLGNPTGYPGEHRESDLFRPDKVVTLGPTALTQGRSRVAESVRATRQHTKEKHP